MLKSFFVCVCVCVCVRVRVWERKINRQAERYATLSQGECVCVCMCATGPLYLCYVLLCVCVFLALQCISVPCVSCCSSCGSIYTHTHRHTHTKRRNESCWELELRSIRVTTYLQTVGGKLPLCDSSAKRHTCTFDSRPASPNCTAQSEGRKEQRDEGREGGRWQGVDRMKNTHMHAGCACVSNRINKYMCVHTNTCTN